MAILVVHFLILSITAVHLASAAAPNITAVFSFGDSVLDAGNNNGRTTIATANHPPYGINFPGGVASGRFTDGKLITDIIATQLGVKQTVPAYLDPALTDKDLVTGVSFASAGSGLDTMVTPKIGNVIGMDKQLEYLGQAVERMRRKVGGEEVKRILEKALVLVSAGSNDMMINKYILPLRYSFTVPKYQDFLINKTEDYVRRLTNIGVRKVAVLGIPPLGCIPLIITTNNIKRFHPQTNRTCVEKYNLDVRAYNVKLKALLSSMATSLPSGTKLSYVDTYDFSINKMKNPTANGFERSDVGCCGKGILEIGASCNKLSAVCRNPSKYLFWDSVHPTHVVYTALAEQIIKNNLPNLI